jgi:hypothetical protein
MAKRLSYEEKKEKLFVDIINKMFEIAGHKVTFEDIKVRKDAWYNDWTMTEQQYDEWVNWGKKYIAKSLRLPATMAEKNMRFFALNYGLKFRNTLK